MNEEATSSSHKQRDALAPPMTPPALASSQGELVNTEQAAFESFDHISNLHYTPSTSIGAGIISSPLGLFA
jgi:hypothetical protein